MSFSEPQMLGLPQSLFPFPSWMTQSSCSSEVFPKGWQDTEQHSQATCSHVFLTHYVAVKGSAEVLTRLNLSSTAGTRCLYVASHNALLFSTGTVLTEGNTVTSDIWQTFWRTTQQNLSQGISNATAYTKQPPSALKEIIRRILLDESLGKKLSHEIMPAFADCASQKLPTKVFTFLY